MELLERFVHKLIPLKLADDKDDSPSPMSCREIDTVHRKVLADRWSASEELMDTGTTLLKSAMIGCTVKLTLHTYLLVSPR